MLSGELFEREPRSRRASRVWWLAPVVRTPSRAACLDEVAALTRRDEPYEQSELVEAAKLCEQMRSARAMPSCDPTPLTAAALDDAWEGTSPVEDAGALTASLAELSMGRRTPRHALEAPDSGPDTRCRRPRRKSRSTKSPGMRRYASESSPRMQVQLSRRPTHPPSHTPSPSPLPLTAPHPPHLTPPSQWLPLSPSSPCRCSSRRPIRFVCAS